MAQALTKLFITHDDAPADVGEELTVEAAEGNQAAQALINMLAGLAGGTRQGSIVAMVESISTETKATATATITQASIVNGTDQITIGKTTISYEASPSGESQIASTGDDDACALALSTAINAHSELQGVVTASVAANVVTITAAFPGELGEHIVLSEAGNGIVLSATNLAVSGSTFSEQLAERTWTFGT